MTLPEVRRYLARHPEKRPQGRTLSVNPEAAAKMRRILAKKQEQSIMSNEKQSRDTVTPDDVAQWRQWREEGLSYQAIADRSGVDISYGGVAYHLKKLEKAEEEMDDSEAASPPLAPTATTSPPPGTFTVEKASVRKNGALQPVWFEALDLDDLDDVVTALKAMTTTAALMGGRVHIQLELEVG